MAKNSKHYLPNFLIFLLPKLQIATVLANMATTELSRLDIVTYSGIPLLITYLQQRPGDCKQEAEVAACERLQQKAAIALTRLCKDSTTAQIIVDLQGISILMLLLNITKTGKTKTFISNFSR